jgi:hypothetical protein
MSTQAKPSQRKKRAKSEFPKVCFVISPIGNEGTDIHKKFKEILDYIIKPAVEESGYGLEVIRADDIKQSGSIIKDILQSLLDAHVVIADLTNQNPNVFYELGVRHALRPRTILISEKSEDIPFDLKDYRTIIYENSAKGVTNFRKKIIEFLNAIEENPERPDNPVLDKIGSIMESNTETLQAENADLKKRLDDLSKGKVKSDSEFDLRKEKSTAQRAERILSLINAKEQYFQGSFSRGVSGKKESFEQPGRQGNFKLYYIMPNNEDINYALYLSKRNTSLSVEDEFADIRVLLERNSQGQEMETKFVIATDQDLNSIKKTLLQKFKKMLTFVPTEQRHYFSLEIWDKEGLSEQEKKLGLKI